MTPYTPEVDMQHIVFHRMALGVCSGLLFTFALFSQGVSSAVTGMSAPGVPTGKLTRSPVLGPADADGVMGGTIPSAMPGWQPHRKDAEDAYVYVPGKGWLQGDTREERQTPHVKPAAFASQA